MTNSKGPTRSRTNRLPLRVFAVTDECRCVAGRDQAAQPLDVCSQRVGHRPHQLLELQELHLDRAQARAARRQLSHAGSGRRAQRSRPLVARQVVHHHRASARFGQCLERVAVDRAGERRRAAHLCMAQRRDQRDGLPVPVRDGGDQPLAPRSPPTRPSRVRFGPCIVDEHTLRRVSPSRPSAAPPATRTDFLHVGFSPRSALPTARGVTDVPSISRGSTGVASGRSFTSVAKRSRSILRPRDPPRSALSPCSSGCCLRRCHPHGADLGRRGHCLGPRSGVTRRRKSIEQASIVPNYPSKLPDARGGVGLL